MPTLTEIRKGFEALGNSYPAEPSVRIEPVTIAGVNAYWTTPENPIAQKIIVYLHGGCFGLGSIKSHGAMITHFAHRLSTTILFIDYSLAPEHPYPQAVNEIVSVYTELLSTHPDHSISFIGDSAGGGLTLSSIGVLQAQHLPQPNSVLLISPWLDLNCDNPSYTEKKDIDRVISQPLLQGFAANYTRTASLESASPHNTSISSFPPALIIVGSNEILLDDSKNFYEKIKPIQDKSKLTIYEDQYHVWPLSDIHSAASQQALTEITAFLMENDLKNP